MPNDLNRVYSAIGMANKAGKIISGTDACLRAIKAGAVKLVVLAEDASDNTKKKIMNACGYSNISCVVYGKGGMLGKVTGKNHRIVAGVRDKNLSKLILSKMQQERELINE
jgi:ribosomal protein L7Ae-like RNA K-turn-binding protein